MIELKPCPKCGMRPMIGCACGKYFIVGMVANCPMCGYLNEMHYSEKRKSKHGTGGLTND